MSTDIRVEATCTECGWSDDGGLAVLDFLQCHAQSTGHIISMHVTPEPKTAEVTPQP